MLLTYTSDQGTTTAESDGQQTHQSRDLHIWLFRTEAGGVVKNTAMLINGSAYSGAAMMEGLRLEVDGQEYEHREPFVIDPGRPWVKTIFEGPELEYWSSITRTQRPPAYAPALFDKPFPVPTLGPYEFFWGPNGYEKGGQGIDHSDGFTWRCFDRGLRYTNRVAERTFMRNHICYLGMDGEPEYMSTPDGFSYSTGSERPKGFNYDADHAHNHWDRVSELQGWRNINDQHYVRAFRDAEWLRRLDPACDFMFRNYVNHAKRAIGADPARDHETRPYYWTVRQLRQHLQRFPGPSPALGRAFAHALRLFGLAEPQGVTARELELCVKLASHPQTGVPYLTTNQQEVNNIYANPDCPWEDNVPIAQVFQWNLLLSSMYLYPGLDAEVARFARFLPKWTRWYSDGKGTYFGGPVPFMGLMRGDLGNKTPAQWYASAKKAKSAEANGSHEMNYGLWPLIMDKTL